MGCQGNSYLRRAEDVKAVPGSITVIAITPGAGLVGSTVQLKVTFTKNGSGGSGTYWYEWTIDGAKQPRQNNVNTFNWDWQVTSVNGNNLASAATFGTSGGHTVYVLYAAPAAPWSTAAGNTLNPWADALEFAVTTMRANNRNDEDAVRMITASLFDQWGLQYDHVRGEPHYIDRNGAFLLGAFMTSSRGNIVNCVDIAAAGYVLARLLGVPHALLGLRLFGYIHPVRIVGMVSYCNNPFYRNPIHSNSPLTPVDALEPERSLFAMHAFNWYESKIYDACCGPRTGTLTVQQYLNLAIDTSTPPEEEEAGSVNEIYPSSVSIN